MSSDSPSEEFNWVDPDVLAWNDGAEGAVYDHALEAEFKEFFQTGWQHSRYDRLRPTWDELIYSDDPRTRVMGKVALWSLVQLLDHQEKTKASPVEQGLAYG